MWCPCAGGYRETVSGRTLQLSTEPVFTNFSVPSDFLVEDHVSCLGSVLCLLTLSFFSKWFILLEKRKRLLFVMDGPQKRERDIYHVVLCHFIFLQC